MKGVLCGASVNRVGPEPDGKSRGLFSCLIPFPLVQQRLSAPATSKPSARTAGSRLPRARQMPPMAKPAMCPARGAPLAHGGAVLSPPRRTPGGHASRSRSPGQADETVTFGSVPIVLQAELRFAGSGFKSLATHPY